MSKGVEFDPVARTLKFVDGEREVISNAGKLVNFLPAEHNYVATINVAFPDFTKDYLYNWNWLNDFFFSPLGDDKLAQDNACTTHITVVPQEWSQETVLAPAPPGADFFAASVRINRTAAPSHSWGGSPISVLPVVNAWIPFSGSVLVEAEIGMARAFSLYLSGGNLMLHRQQSVGVPPGGWGVYGDPQGWGSGGDGVTSGGENVYGTSQGIPVVQRDIRNSPPDIYEPPGFFTPAVKSNHRRGGAAACATSDITNFASTYQVEVIGRFGRRS